MAEPLLTFFEGEELVYFIPRFIVRFVDEVRAGTEIFSSVTNSFFYHLSVWKRDDYGALPLTEAQKSVLDSVIKLGLTFRDLKATFEPE